MLPKKVRIRELGPREGFQTLKQVIPTVKKLELIEALSHTGVSEIEVTSFVRSDRVPQMADAEELVSKLKPSKGLRYSALYLNLTGYSKAEAMPNLSNEAWLYAAASESFLNKNNNTNIADVIAKIPEWLAAFSTHNKTLQGLMLSAAFGCNYEGTVAPEKVVSILKMVIDRCHNSGATLREVCLADTMGRGNPVQVKKLIELVRETFPNLYISLHFHDTRGVGLANCLAGLELGIDCFDASVGGMGGCPFALGSAGNVCTEDLAYMCEEMGIQTGLNLGEYAKAAEIAEKIVGTSLPGKYYRAFKSAC